MFSTPTPAGPETRIAHGPVHRAGTADAHGWLSIAVRHSLSTAVTSSRHEALIVDVCDQATIALARDHQEGYLSLS
jgi:GAF domain-containing protein